MKITYPKYTQSLIKYNIPIFNNKIKFSCNFINFDTCFLDLLYLYLSVMFVVWRD